MTTAQYEERHRNLIPWCYRSRDQSECHGIKFYMIIEVIKMILNRGFILRIYKNIVSSVLEKETIA